MAFTHSPKIATNGLVLYVDAANNKSYPGSGTIWADLSGNNNSGSLVNSPSFSGSNGGSIALDGINDYVDIANQAAFNFANTTFTVSMWVKTVSVATQLVISKGYLTDGWAWAVASTGIVSVDTKNNAAGASACSRDSIKVINDGIWHNVVVIYTTNTTVVASNDIQIYIDGAVSQGTVSKTLTYSSSTSNVNLGRRSTGLYFNGNIANTFIYNRALSPTEILQNFNTQRSRFDA